MSLSPTFATAQGPGLGNLTYEDDEVFRPVGMIRSPDGHGRVAMVGGYLMVIYSSDGGGSSGNGGIELWDVSDPRSPERVAQHDDDDTHAVREPHGFSLSPSYGGTTLALQGVNGVMFWDVTDPRAIRRLSYLDLPGIGRADYGGDWWIAWQAPYLYVAGSGSGLYVVDASDPSSPFLVRQMPTSQLAGINPMTVFAVGNLLVVTQARSNRYATLDISEPTSPVLIDALSGRSGYSHLFAAGMILSSGGNGDPSAMYVHRVSHSGEIQLVGEARSGLGNGGYGSYQDGFFISGFSTGIAKFDIDAMNRVGTGSSGMAGRDEDFGIVLGNMVWAGNDHSGGSALIPHQAQPDERGPEVVWMHPAQEAEGIGLRSRIGVSMSDQVAVESVDSGTFIVRRRGGEPIAGRYSVSDGIVNFAPDEPLAPSTTYEVVVDAIVDWAGNAGGRFETTLTTSDGTIMGGGALDCQIADPTPVEVGARTGLQYDGEVSGLSHSWDFGDGTPVSEPTDAGDVTHGYERPGRYVIVLAVSDDSRVERCSAVQIVYAPATPIRPTHSSSIALAHGIIAAVNTDHGTLGALDADSLEPLWEAATGDQPRTVAASPAGDFWVVNQGDATLSVVSQAGVVRRSIELPHGSQPYGVAFGPDGHAYVSLEARGELLKVSPDGDLTDTLVLGNRARGISIANGSILVSRFVSPGTHGEIYNVDEASFSLDGIIELAMDPGPDTEASGRGVPNYIAHAVVSPDGAQAVVVSKKDNVSRGLYRDGLELTFETRVRAMASVIDVSAGVELLDRRLDFNDREMPQAVAFSPLGDLLFVAFQGTNAVEAFDTRSGAPLARLNTGRAPQGLVLSQDGSRLYVQNFLSRSVTAFDTAALIAGRANEAPEIAEIRVAEGEPLAEEVLHGKQIFYDASDPRMSRDGYISCASCHVEGGEDGQVWDFTQAGEGLRNTISLLGRAGTGHGNVHWTANFDEIQDFENDIRLGFGGTGFLTDEDFAQRVQPLGEPKAGRDADLDALAAYVESLDQLPPSPHRNDDGSLTSEAAEGRDLFIRLGCQECHGGDAFSDLERHDVGTTSTASGLGRGDDLADIGFDTPTLRGVWASAPYFHDGSAPTLEAMLRRHFGEELGEPDTERLIAYLRSIDGVEPALDPGAIPAGPTAPDDGAIEGVTSCQCNTTTTSLGAWPVALSLLLLVARRVRK